MDLSTENIMRQLHIIYGNFGSPTECNEFQYDSEVRQLISQLEIYDQGWVARDSGHAIQKVNGGVLHSEQGRILAKKIVDFLLEDEGCAECFPYNLIEELKREFWLDDFKLWLIEETKNASC